MEQYSILTWCSFRIRNYPVVKRWWPGISWEQEKGVTTDKYILFYLKDDNDVFSIHSFLK